MVLRQEGRLTNLREALWQRWRRKLRQNTGLLYGWRTRWMCFVAKDSQRGRNNDGLVYVASLLYSSVLGSSD